jgi:hypothetical protein
MSGDGVNRNTLSSHSSNTLATIKTASRVRLSDRRNLLIPLFIP